MIELSDIIKSYISPLIENKNNWYHCICAVCNDHQPGSTNFKGLRGNFLLNGNTVSYNCFNCDIKARFDLSSDNKFHGSMIKVLDSFNIPQQEYNKFLLENIGNTAVIIKSKDRIQVEPDTIKLPDHFYKLEDAVETDKWKIISEHYLRNRMIDPKS